MCIKKHRTDELSSSEYTVYIYRLTIKHNNIYLVAARW